MAKYHAVLRERSSVRRESRKARTWWLWLEHRVRLLRLVHLLLFVPNAESLRCRHYGQFRLFNERLVDPGRSSLGRVRPDLGRIRSKRNGQDPLHRDVRHAQEHGSTVGVW